MYCWACAKAQRLPVAPPGEMAVLFVISAENNGLYKHVRYNLYERFSQLDDIEAARFTAICVPKERLKKYHLKQAKDIQQILKKTNCQILVNVSFDVDDVSHADNYEMHIDYNVLQPECGPDEEEVFFADIRTLGALVKDQSFVRSQSLGTFKSTAQTLSFSCQYVLSLACLVSKDYDTAIRILEGLKDELTETKGKGSASILNRLVDIRRYDAYINKAYEMITRFEDNLDKAYLLLAADSLDEANLIIPDSYVYCLNMAYVCILLSHDAERARTLIEKCKMTRENDDWKYSAAFLGAYQGNDPMSIYAKYREAFETGYNPVKIIHYIEYILLEEPERKLLHFAAGLLYDNIGDARQMKIHFSWYLEEAIPDKRAERMIGEKMRAHDCGVTCDNNCLNCNENLNVMPY